MSFYKLIDKTIDTAHNHNIRVKLNMGRYTYVDNTKCGGYFDDGARILVTALGNKYWKSVFIHEGCHMDQYLENSKYWRELYVNKEDISVDFWDWLSGINIPKKRLIAATKVLQNLERDCERRTIKKIKEYKVNIDLNNYIQIANHYLYSYTHILKSRNWESSCRKNFKISTLPTILLKNHTVIPKNILRQFDAAIDNANKKV